MVSDILAGVRVPLRRAAGVLAVVLLAFPAAGCGLFGDSSPTPEDVASDFLGAFARGDAGAAANLTDSPDSAKALLAKLRGALDPEKVAAQLRKVETRADVGDGDRSRSPGTSASGRRWDYDGRLRAAQRGRRVAGALGPRRSCTRSSPQQQSIAVQSDAAGAGAGARPRRRAAAGARTLSSPCCSSWRRRVTRRRWPARSRTALAGFDRTITQQSILDGASKAPDGQAYQVVALRSTRLPARSSRGSTTCPACGSRRRRACCPADKKFAPTLLPGIRKVVEDELTGQAGWRVITTDASGAEVAELYAKAAEPAEAATRDAERADAERGAGGARTRSGRRRCWSRCSRRRGSCWRWRRTRPRTSRVRSR